MRGPDIDLDALNDELISATRPESPKPSTPKRNSKDDLIAKIVKVCDVAGLDLPQSNSKLRRMTKTQLMELLAKCTEEAMRAEMAAKVRCSKGASDSMLALAALRMAHDVFAMTFEKGVNLVLPGYCGYEVNGFVASLKDPMAREAVDACLLEIAQENGDILKYIESPYARLMIAWSGALMVSVRKSPVTTNAKLESPTAREQDPRRQSRPMWGTQNGKVDRAGRPTAPIILEV